MAAAVGLDHIIPSPLPLSKDGEMKGINEQCGGLAAAMPSTSSSSLSSSSTTTRTTTTTSMTWSRYLPRMMIWVCVGGLLLVSATLSATFAYASTLNYPGKAHTNANIH